MSQPNTMKTLNDIADFNEIFPDATPQQKYWMAEYGSIMKDRGIAETLTQKDAEVVEMLHKLHLCAIGKYEGDALENVKAQIKEFQTTSKD